MAARGELRVDEATKERWRTAAAARGCSLTEFVTACVEAALTELSPEVPARPPTAVAATSPGKRSYKPDFKQERTKRPGRRD